MFIHNRKILLAPNSLIFLTLATGILVAMSVAPARALTIIREHISPGESFEFDGLQFAAGKAPANTLGGGTLIDVFNAAADSWESSIRDDHTITIQYGWSPLPIGNGVHNVRFQSGIPNRITEAIVYFDNDGSTTWFLDPTPHDHSEYPTTVTCYADLGQGRLNSGRVFSDGMKTSQALDLFTIALHEIGHALGFSTWNYQWVLKNAAEGIYVHAPRPFSGSVIPVDAGGHLRLHGALMDQALLPGQRKLMSVVDVLAIAELGEFIDLNLNWENLLNHTGVQHHTTRDPNCGSSH